MTDLSPGRARVAVVIVNYNGRYLLEDCLTSVRTQVPAPDRVVVVDNGSSDGSADYLRAAWPEVEVIDAGSNLGFAAGNNLGIRAALAAEMDHVLLLNNDAQLLPGALGQLLGALESQGRAAWAAAPKILYHVDPGVIWSAGGRFDWWRGLSIDRGWNERDVGQYDRPELVEFSNACCLLVRARVFRETGLLDPDYFMYFEDSELAARAARTGSRVAYVPSARVLHAVQGGSTSPGESSPTALYYWTRNRPRFISRNVPGRLRRLVAHAYVWGTRAIRILQAAVAGRPEEARLILRAMVDGYGARATRPTR